MRVIWHGINKQIGTTMPRQVVCAQWHPLGENEPIRRQAAARRLFLEIFLDGGITCRKPQDAALDLFQYPHPTVEHLGRYLVVIIETTKYKPCAWQTKCLADKV